jgi:hypothetical protein
MWAAAVASACFQLFLYLPTAFAMLFAAAGGENATEEDIADARSLVYAAPALLVVAVVTIVAVARQRPLWATLGDGQVAIGVPVLLFALEGSVHSDPKLLVVAAIVWALGVVAVVGSFPDVAAR